MPISIHSEIIPLELIGYIGVRGENVICKAKFRVVEMLWRFTGGSFTLILVSTLLNVHASIMARKRGLLVSCLQRRKEMVFKSRLLLGTKQNWSLVAVHIDIGCVVSVLKCHAWRWSREQNNHNHKIKFLEHNFVLDPITPVLKR